MKLQDCMAGIAVHDTRLQDFGILTGRTKSLRYYRHGGVFVSVEIILQYGESFWADPDNIMLHKKSLNTTSAEEIQ